MLSVAKAICQLFLVSALCLGFGGPLHSDEHSEGKVARRLQGRWNMAKQSNVAEKRVSGKGFVWFGADKAIVLETEDGGYSGTWSAVLTNGMPAIVLDGNEEDLIRIRFYGDNKLSLVSENSTHDDCPVFEHEVNPPPLDERSAHMLGSWRVQLLNDKPNQETNAVCVFYPQHVFVLTEKYMTSFGDWRLTRGLWKTYLMLGKTDYAISFKGTNSFYAIERDGNDKLLFIRH